MSVSDLFPDSKHDPALVAEVLRKSGMRRLQQKAKLYRETQIHYRALLGMAIAVEARGGRIDEHTSTVGAARFEMEVVKDELIAAACALAEVES